MATLDAGIVNTALPTIATGFGAGVSEVQWIVGAYFLVISCLLPLFGRMGDMNGRRTKYRLGFLLFALSSALCGAAPGMWWLIAGRSVQAIGAALLMANGPAIVIMSFPGHQRGRALGTIGMVVSLGSLAGPSLGGLLVGWLGWPSIFYVNVPIGILGAVLAHKVLPDDKHASVGTFDLIGAMQYALGMVFLLVAITHGGRWGWASPGILACEIVALAALGLFLRRQAVVKHPMVDLTLFRIRTLALGNLASLLAFMALLTNAIMLPFFLVRVGGLSAHQTGLVMAALPLVMAFVAPLSGYLSERISHSFLTGLGMAITAAGLYSQTLLTASSGFERFALGQAVLGLGFGIFLSPNNNAVMGSAPVGKSGVAGALMGLVRNLGMTSGIAIATAMFEAYRNKALASGLSELSSFTAGFNAALAFATGLALAGVAVSFVRAWPSSSKSH